MHIDEVACNLFRKNQKCIINADLDGILSGMLLQQFLGWEVIGYSSCCGKLDDELWLEEKNEDIEDIRECVFVDLPVYVPDISVIDQHFVLLENDSIAKYNENKNKLNPNVMRKRLFKNQIGENQYTKKYPFGTAHFILALLEKLNIIFQLFRLKQGYGY